MLGTDDQVIGACAHMNLEEAAARVDTDRGLRWLWAGIWLLFALAMGACISNGADGPADPQLQDAARVPGFAEVAVEIDPAEGDAEEYCALLADTDQLRAQGMIGLSDFAGYDGMIFVYETDVQNGFHMRGVPIPLSIGWFDREGRFVSGTDMVPCPQATPECPSYMASGPFRTALEVPQGGLRKLGATPGSVLSVGGACG